MGSFRSFRALRGLGVFWEFFWEFFGEFLGSFWAFRGLRFRGLGLCKVFELIALRLRVQGLRCWRLPTGPAARNFVGLGVPLIWGRRQVHGRPHRVAGVIKDCPLLLLMSTPNKA